MCAFVYICVYEIQLKKDSYIIDIANCKTHHYDFHVVKYCDTLYNNKYAFLSVAK